MVVVVVVVVVVVGGGGGAGFTSKQQPGFSNSNSSPEHGSPGIGQVLAPQRLGMQGRGQGAGSQVGRQRQGRRHGSWRCSIILCG